MKKLLLLTIAIWYLTAGCYSQTDWKSFMSRQDMTWTRLPQTWYEAPFMGNGSMGSYICKEPGKNAIRVDVGNSMVHDHRTDDASIYGRGRLLIGYFLLHPVGEIKSGDLRLDLWNAETTGCIRTTRGEIKLRACVTSESPYILVEAEATYNPQIQISAESETKRSIFREKDKTKRSKKESAQHSKSRNKSFVMTSVSAL